MQNESSIFASALSDFNGAVFLALSLGADVAWVPGRYARTQPSDLPGLELSGTLTMMNIDNVKMLKLEPGQTLLVQMDDFISIETAKRVRELIETNVPMLKDRLLIVGKGVDFSVIDAS